MNEPNNSELALSYGQVERYLRDLYPVLGSIRSNSIDDHSLLYSMPKEDENGNDLNAVTLFDMYHDLVLNTDDAMDFITSDEKEGLLLALKPGDTRRVLLAYYGVKPEDSWRETFKGIQDYQTYKLIPQQRFPNAGDVDRVMKNLSL